MLHSCFLYFSSGSAADGSKYVYLCHAQIHERQQIASARLVTKLGQAANQFLQCPGVQQGRAGLLYESLFVDSFDLYLSGELLF